MNFAERHYQHEPLLIANVWDAASAVAAQKQAIRYWERPARQSRPHWDMTTGREYRLMSCFI